MRIYAWVVYSLVGVALFVTTISSATAEVIRVVGFGDSITNGWPYYKYPPGDGARWGGYQPNLESKLVAAGLDAIVLNYGWSGESTHAEPPEYIGGFNRLGSVLSASQPHFVLLKQGTNDLDGVYHPPIYSASQVVNNLSAMVDIVRQHGAIPILATLTPDTSRSKDIAGTNQLIRDLAQQKGVELADHHDVVVGDWPALTSDGLHPNHSGYQALADTWFSALEKHLVVKALNISPILHLLLN